MSTDLVNDVVIVGRDAPLWLTACAVQAALGPSGVKVTAVELPSLLRAPDVYATLPALEALHNRLRIDEATLLGNTGGSFSLGQNFTNTTISAVRSSPLPLGPLSRIHAPATFAHPCAAEVARSAGEGSGFFHAYGAYGAPIDHKSFLPHWLMARTFGLQVALEDFSLTAAAAKQGRMLIPDAATESYGRTDYGYHLPAIEYARALKRHASRRGVSLHEADAVSVVLNPIDGAIAAVDLGSDRRVTGQFFIDATGADALLIRAAMGVQRDSWREHFVVDRVLHASAPRFTSIPPYAEVRAWDDGWLGLYPSQARTHIVQAYSSASCGDEEALQAAMKVSGATLQDAAMKTSNPGRSAVAWERNCVAIGEAACEFDPIHSVDLQAVQLGLVHLLSLFPVHSDFAVERVEYNRTLKLAFERVRDFQSAHYTINRYAQSPFWNRARETAASPGFAHKLATFRARGEVPLYENETFSLESWQAIFIGHGVLPETHDPIVDSTPPDLTKQEFRRILGFIKAKVLEQASHDFYLQSVCAGRGSAA